jgi:hypothetical protein
MKKALLIGMNYFDTQYTLHGCINDVNNMKDMLLNHFGFAEDNFTVLVDDDTSTELPSKDTILYHLDNLVRDAREGDVLVLHYSGHGTQILDYNGDEKTGFDDAIIPMDYEKNGVISDDTIFKQLVSKVPKGVKLVVFFDCCHSGTMCDLEYNMKYVAPKRFTTDLDKWNDRFVLWEEKSLSVPGTVYMFSGCYDEQTSADAFINMKSQGAFTFVIIDILHKFNFNVTYKQLLKYINATLSLQGFEQRSQLSFSLDNTQNEQFGF